MKRIGAALFIMITGLLPVFAAGEKDFFVSNRPRFKSSAMTSVSEDRVRQSQRETENNRRNQTLRYTVLRFDSGVGDIAVQPIVGKVNGAQLYVSF
jgi:hypothetical protein